MMQKLLLLSRHWPKAMQYHYVKTYALFPKSKISHQRENTNNDIDLLQRILNIKIPTCSTSRGTIDRNILPEDNYRLSLNWPSCVKKFKRWHGGNSKQNGNFEKFSFQEISLWVTGLIAIYGGIISHSWFSRNDHKQCKLKVLSKNRPTLLPVFGIKPVRAIDSNDSLPPGEEKSKKNVKELDKAVLSFQQASNECCGSLLNKYAMGFRKNNEYKKAFELLGSASTYGYASSLYNLGLCYEHGHGVESSLEKAARYYQKAAEKGHLKSMFNIATFHFNGNGYVTDESKDTGFVYMKKAADLGLLQAQKYLAIKFAESRNWCGAFRYYMLAADQHDMSSIYQVAICLEKGLGVEKDIREAMKYLFLSADMGHGLSQFHLGDSYQHGIRGIKRDLKESMKWFKLALENGIHESEKRIELLENQMTLQNTELVNSDTKLSLFDFTKNINASRVQDSILLYSVETDHYDNRNTNFFDIRSIKYCDL